MDRTALHLEIRNALSAADELSRHEHYVGDDARAGALAALRTSLGDLEREVGRSHADESALDPDHVASMERALQSLVIRREEAPRALRRRTEALLASGERISLALWEPAERMPSKPLLGLLPLARVVPQDVHSVLDYVHSAGFFLSARLARTKRATAVGVALGVGTAGAAMATDHRLSAAKLVPIELHEGLDYASGLTAIAAPFLLGYVRKDPISAWLQIGLGALGVATALVTDYRASKGLTLPRRSQGGPHIGPSRGQRGIRVPDVQRPLEGLSSAQSSDWESVVGSGGIAPEPKPPF